ncbi:MAG: hypothetical protein HY234_09125 [Acidobacteria bacterium]|nr:hypothetical protein [Acidobacteriota bacterium]MBI3663196.1 hypothetical protein [Acidobacteriota bacterium]
MASQPAPILGEKFTAPAVLAKLKALLLLARALQPQLRRLCLTADFRENPINSLEIIRKLGGYYQNNVESIEEPDNVMAVWGQFEQDLEINRLPRTVAPVLADIREALETHLAGSEDPIVLLAQANQSGYELLRSILHAYGLGELLPPAPARLFLDYDPKLESYCASTSRADGQIHWAFHLRGYALSGAILGDLVFAHEYLSHLVPRNRYLSRDITEGWLVVALCEEVREKALDFEEARWKLALLDIFRNDLAEVVTQVRRATSGQSLLPFTSKASVTALARSLYFHSPQTFWRLTQAILTLRGQSEEAESVDELLEEIGKRRNQLQKQLLKENWATVTDFLRGVRKTPSA